MLDALDLIDPDLNIDLPITHPLRVYNKYSYPHPLAQQLVALNLRLGDLKGKLITEESKRRTDQFNEVGRDCALLAAKQTQRADYPIDPVDLLRLLGSW